LENLIVDITPECFDGANGGDGVFVSVLGGGASFGSGTGSKEIFL
jgi:hypothetical protein